MPIPAVGGRQHGQDSDMFFCRGCRRHYTAAEAHARKGNPGEAVAKKDDPWVAPFCAGCAAKAPESMHLKAKRLQNPEPPRRP